MSIKASGLMLAHHAAEIMFCTPRTVVNKIKSGELEGFKVGRKYLVKRESVLKYIENGKIDQEKIFS